MTASMTAASELCEDNQSKWKNMLRTNGSSQKPQWKAAIKVRSPSERSYAEGGSLRTNRLGNRGRSETRSTRSRSPSPGLFGSTASSRAKQRDAIISRSRSMSMAPTTDHVPRRKRSDSRQRNRSESPVRKVRERPPSVPQRSEAPRKSDNDSVDTVNKTAVWVAPRENPLEFQYFKKNFLDFNDEYQYCYTSSDYNMESSKNVKNVKKKVSYADCKKFVSLGFRVL